jgi:nucleotide-binding universal stress UspA family protein
MKVYLDLNTKELKAQKIEASTAIAHGSEADGIIKFANKNKIDLIIISTHGHSGIKHCMLGSELPELWKSPSTGSAHPPIRA